MIVFGIINLMSQDDQLAAWLAVHSDPIPQDLILFVDAYLNGRANYLLQQIVDREPIGTCWRWHGTYNKEKFYVHSEIVPATADFNSIGINIHTYKRWTTKRSRLRASSHDPYPGLLIPAVPTPEPKTPVSHQEGAIQGVRMDMLVVDDVIDMNKNFKVFDLEKK